MRNASKSTRRTKPYPWKCRKCGKIAIRPEIVSYPITVEYDGRAYPITIDGLKAPRCQECGQVFPDAEANRQISQAFRCHVKLLTPQQIRRNREALGLTQKQLAATLGIAEATLSRWETGGQIQQRSLDKLLRLFFEFSEVRKALTDEQRVLQLGTDVRAGQISVSLSAGVTRGVILVPQGEWATGQLDYESSISAISPLYSYEPVYRQKGSLPLLTDQR